MLPKLVENVGWNCLAIATVFVVAVIAAAILDFLDFLTARR